VRKDGRESSKVLKMKALKEKTMHLPSFVHVNKRFVDRFSIHLTWLHASIIHQSFLILLGPGLGIVRSWERAEEVSMSVLELVGTGNRRRFRSKATVADAINKMELD